MTYPNVSPYIFSYPDHVFLNKSQSADVSYGLCGLTLPEHPRRRHSSYSSSGIKKGAVIRPSH